MVDEEIWLREVGPAKRAHFFAELSHGMTVALRVICRDDKDALLERVSAVNEAHHLVSRYLLSLQVGQEDVRWLKPTLTAVLCQIDSVVKEQLELAWRHARQAVLINSEDQASEI